LTLNTLSDVPDITLVCLGGMLRYGEGSFIGIRSVDPEHGLTNDHLPETMTDRAILGIGR
jgi:DeoR/GlpR family transcriptional regulator of sugar metabolism